jgi:hypothetical protein
MRKNCLKSVTILVMLSMFMVAPNVASAFTLIELMLQVALMQMQMMSLTDCDQPIQLENFDSRVLHEKVKIKSVYVDLTNSSKVQLHLKLDRDDPFGAERAVYVHKCMRESLGVALSSKGKIQTHAVVGLDSSGDAVLIRISIGKHPMIPDPEN